MKNIQKLVYVVLIVVLIATMGFLVACADNGKEPSNKVEVALVCSAAGKNDNGYNQSAIEGLEAVAKAD